MRKLEELKTDLLNDKLDNLYIFFGEDVGIRKHYIDKIASYFNSKILVDSCADIGSQLVSNSLFQIKQLFIIINDDEFSNQKKDILEKFISKLNKNNTCIFVYDDLKFNNTNLFKYFECYCTNFQGVQPNIAKEFVESELLGLRELDEEELAYNCDNFYSNILLEADKIKQYQNYTAISQQSSYDTLKLKNQLIKKYPSFSYSEFVDAILLKNSKDIAYWYDVLMQKDNGAGLFKYLVPIYNDFLIAGLCKLFGKFEGSSKAYQYKLPWYRAVRIREFDLVEDANSYFEVAYMVANLDSLIKCGKIPKDNILDYFLTKVI